MWWGKFFCKSCGIELIDVGTYLMILVSISWWWVVFGESNSWISLFVTSWRYFGSVDTNATRNWEYDSAKRGYPLVSAMSSQLYLKMAKMRLLHAVLSKREVFDTSPFKTIWNWGSVIDSGWPMGRLILSVMVLIGKASVSRDSNADLTYVVYIFSENWSSDMVFCFLLGESDGEMTRLRVSTDMAMVGGGVR